MNPVIFGSLIDLCLKKADHSSKVGEDEKQQQYFLIAQRLFDEMESLGITHSLISLSLKIKLFNRLGLAEKAVSCLDEIPRCKLK